MHISNKMLNTIFSNGVYSTWRTSLSWFAAHHSFTNVNEITQCFTVNLINVVQNTIELSSIKTWLELNCLHLNEMKNNLIPVILRQFHWDILLESLKMTLQLELTLRVLSVEVDRRRSLKVLVFLLIF